MAMPRPSKLSMRIWLAISEIGTRPTTPDIFTPSHVMDSFSLIPYTR